MTTMNPFASIPSPSDGVTWTELNGALLIIKPTSLETGVQTVHGPSDAVRVSLWVLDGTNAGEVHDDALVFPKLLQSQLKARINQVVLGRLGQGHGKPGQSAPWMLNEPSAQDVQVGMAAWERIQAGTQAPPAQAQAQAPVQQQVPAATTLQPQTQAPAQQSWGAPAQAPQQTVPAQQDWNNAPPF